jgi:sigma-B regulation protein RsbU (phosphoserine phosphatase)
MSSDKTILCVDDSEFAIKTLLRILSRHYVVLTASSGKQAIEMAASDRPDLILLDIVMPGQTGLEVCKTLKGNPGTMNIPVIFVTSVADATTEEYGLQLGAADYIKKPITPGVVLWRIKNALNRYGECG